MRSSLARTPMQCSYGPGCRADTLHPTLSHSRRDQRRPLRTPAAVFPVRCVLCCAVLCSGVFSRSSVHRLRTSLARLRLVAEWVPSVEMGTVTELDDADGHLVFLFLGLSVLLGLLTRQLVVHYRLPVPYEVVVLVVGVLLGLVQLSGSSDDVVRSVSLLSHIEPALLLYVFLPILLFESAFSVNYRTLSIVLAPTLLMALPGVLIIALLTGGLIYASFPYSWDWAACMLLGSILSATDPVSTVAILKDVGAFDQVTTIIEAESLLNDGVAFVLYTLVLHILLASSSSQLTAEAAGEAVSVPAEIADFIRKSVLGPVFGWSFAVVSSFTLSFVTHHTAVEVTGTVLCAYLCYLLADSYMGSSAVLSLVVFGLFMGRWRNASLSPPIHHALHHIWTWLVYVANTLLFLLSGVIVCRALFVLPSGVGTASDFGYLALLYLILQLTRAAAVAIVYPLCRLCGYRLSWREAVMLSWSGLRGTISLMLALMTAMEAGLDRETGDRMLFHTAGVVLLTNVINGSVSRLLVKKLRLNEDSVEDKRLGQLALRKLRASFGAAERTHCHTDSGAAASSLSHNGEPADHALLLPLPAAPPSLSSASELHLHALLPPSITAAPNPFSAYPSFTDVHVQQQKQQQHLQWAPALCIRCLDVLKQHYLERYERGYLGVHSFDLLTAACDTGMDKGQFSAFTSSVHAGLAVPWYLMRGYEAGLTRRVPALHHLLRRQLYKHHTLVLATLDALLLSMPHCRSVVRLLECLDDMDDTACSSMTAVIDAYQHVLQRSLAATRRAYPQVDRSVAQRTSAVDRILFGYRQADQLRTAGLLTKKQLEDIEDELQSQMQAVERTQRSLPHCDGWATDVSAVPFLRSASEKQRKAAVRQLGRFRLFQSGDVLCRADEQAEGAFVLLRGVAEMKRRSGSGSVQVSQIASVQVASPGSISSGSAPVSTSTESEETTGCAVNLMPAMLGLPAACTCTALTVVEALHFTQPALRSVATVLSTERSLWEQVAQEAIAHFFSTRISLPSAASPEHAPNEDELRRAFVRHCHMLHSADVARLRRLPHTAALTHMLLLRGDVQLTTAATETAAADTPSSHRAHCCQAPALLQLGISDAPVDIEPSSDALCLAWNERTLMDDISSATPAGTGRSDKEKERESGKAEADQADGQSVDEDDEEEKGVELAILVSSSLLTTAGSMSDADDLV